MLAVEENRLGQFISDSSNPNEVLKNTGDLRMLRKLRAWPKMMIDVVDNVNVADEKRLTHAKEKEDAERERESAASRSASRR